MVLKEHIHPETGQLINSLENHNGLEQCQMVFKECNGLERVQLMNGVEWTQWSWKMSTNKWSWKIYINGLEKNSHDKW